MHEKKIRGMKRKTNAMIKRIEEHTKMFPSTFYNDEYWYMPLPVSQDFIESHKTPRKVKRLSIQTLIDRVNHLIKIQPSDTHTYRVVALISIENLWRSQIIVFKNDDYFHNFFNRNNEFQKWILLSNEIDFWETWGISIFPTPQLLRFQEVIYDEDTIDEKEIWFIGELS
ncbi:group-specific protein [Bacillus anthracis]|nr:group-specific protein [Bacillus anthracis]KOS26882.1 group-specific protein [Bacillus anthracis]